MRSTVSLSLGSALLLASPLVSAVPAYPRRASVEVDSAPLPVASTGATKIALHRRSSAELTREDGTVDFDKTLAHLNRVRAKYVRGAANFERNTGKSLFLAPELVDPSLLPSDASSTSDDLVRRAAWGTGDESSLDWSGDEIPSTAGGSAASRFARRASAGDVFDPAARFKGVPQVANKRALQKRVIKNPKVVPNPKFKASSTTTTAAVAAQTGGVALTDYQDGTLFYGKLSIGSPATDYLIDFDTGSADLWVPSSSCTSAACNAHTKYDPSSSSTSAKVAGKKLSITYGDGSSTSGDVYSDTVSIAGLTASSQTFGVATSLTSDFQSDPYDGLMGMAYASISTLGTNPLFQTLVNENKVASPQFSFLLAETGSELFLGGMNAAHYAAGSTKWYPVASQSYWLLSTQANVAGKQVSSVGSFNSIVDTGTSVIVAPTAAAKKFWAAVPNSGEYSSGSGYYTFPCDTDPTISFSFGDNNQWAVSLASLNLGLVSSGSSQCVGAVVAADIGLGSTWILGAAFLENVYSTYDLSTNSVGFSDLA
ncbi:hypothetical protein JCM8097_004759 [Rhodosporidiobolus ruineniae]